MSGMRILDESTYYWVWSAHGKSDNGHYYNRTFVNGMVPCPLPGDIAAEMEAVGFCLTAFVEGEWFSHWEQDPGSFRQHPVFSATKPIEYSTTANNESPVVEPAPVFPPVEFPAKLPPEWVSFFAKYTAGGSLKKEHRGL
jgi:hypothetical protein